MNDANKTGVPLFIVHVVVHCSPGAALISRRLVALFGLFTARRDEANPRSAMPSVVKAIPDLNKHFARIHVMRSTKGKAIVQENAAVSDVDALNIHGEVFAKIPAH